MNDEDYGKTGLMLIFGSLAIIVAVVFIIGVLGLGWGRVAGPIQEETRRQTFEQSQAYRSGMAQELESLCFQRRHETDATARAGLADEIRHRSADYHGELPANTQQCIQEVQ